jgi:hypothetical protein
MRNRLHGFNSDRVRVTSVVYWTVAGLRTFVPTLLTVRTTNVLPAMMSCFSLQPVNSLSKHRRVMMRAGCARWCVCVCEGREGRVRWLRTRA